MSVYDQWQDKDSAPVHAVTQIVNSLLGLVVLPHGKGYAIAKDKSLVNDLCKQGWPKWTIELAVPEEDATLGNLIFHLRNAAAHGRYWFSSDSRLLSEVTITVNDWDPREKKIVWIAKIRADQLLYFCRCLSEHMKAK